MGLFDYLVTQGRRDERRLARKVWSDATCQANLRAAFGKLETAFPTRIAPDLLATPNRYGYCYSSNFLARVGSARRDTVRQGLTTVAASLVKAVPDTHTDQQIVAVLVGANRIVRRHIKVEAESGQVVPGMPGASAAGLFNPVFRIEGEADWLRSYRHRKNHCLGGTRNEVYWPDTSQTAKFNSANGPSATTMEVLNLCNYIGCTREELRAVGWGLFAWWRTHIRPGSKHSFQEVMIVLQSYIKEDLYSEVPEDPLAAPDGKTLHIFGEERERGDDLAVALVVGPDSEIGDPDSPGASEMLAAGV